MTAQLERFHARNDRRHAAFDAPILLSLVVLAGAGRRALPVVDYPPATVKVAVAGSGAAGKDVVARGVSALLGLAVEPGDTSDALAVAICHLRHTSFASRLRSSDGTAATRRTRLRSRYLVAHR